MHPHPVSNPPLSRQPGPKPGSKLVWQLGKLLPLLAGLWVSGLSGLAHGHDSSPAHLQRFANVEVFDRTAGHALPVYVHRNRLYVAGEPGHQYELRIGNRTSQRLLAVASVDGVNVITGQTANPKQSGYVLEPWDGVDIQGWRKSMNEVATFYFTHLSDSYAARTGRPDDVGVIGVALFRERGSCCRHQPFTDREDRVSPAAPSARAEAQTAEEHSSNKARDRLGTGHGEHEASPAQYVNFPRASNTPAETIVIYYDSRKHLVAQGVIRDSQRYVRHARPNPFPEGPLPEGMFAPDP